MDAGNYPETVRLLDEALQKSDGLVGAFELDVLQYRAEAEYRMGDYSSAADTYDVLWQADGDKSKTEYLTRCCAMLVLAGRLDEAKEQYNVLYPLEKESEDTVQVLLALGEALNGADRRTEATELYRQAVDDGVRNGELYNRLALNEIDIGEYDQALAFIDLGLAAGDGARGNLLYNQAVILEKKLDFAGALRVLEDYEREFGASEEVEKEIAFLKTRTD